LDYPKDLGSLQFCGRAAYWNLTFSVYEFG
jgi:hypothetical protein